MPDQPLPDLDAWVNQLSAKEIPILRQTARRLDEAHQNVDRLGGREVAAIVLQDPLMAVRVLAYMQAFQGKRLNSQITTIGNAVMMLGVEPFFRAFESPLTVETVLKDEAPALLGVLQVVRRAQRASHYAYEWSRERLDLNVEEVTLAALLHDLAEILLWCFAPREATAIRKLQQADRSLHSADAQRQVLGFALADLQKALCARWHLPELLGTLMDDANSAHARVRNVTLATKLARHSANDWSDAALPDDLCAIASLLHIDVETLRARLRIPAEVRVSPTLAAESAEARLDDSPPPPG